MSGGIGMSVFDGKGRFKEYPEDAETLHVEKPGAAWKVIGISTLVGLILVAIWIVIVSRATWIDLGLSIIVGVIIFAVCWGTAIYWIAWRPNRRDDN